MSDWDSYGSKRNERGAVYESDTGYYDSGSDHGFREKAKEGVDQVRNRAQEAGGRARHGFEHYFEKHPLLMGLGAMALGIAVGMTLPSSRQENRWLGEASDRMKERTRDAAEKVGEVAKTSFEEARDTARSEMDQRGLDANSMKEGAQHATQEAREVAEKAASEAKRTAKEEAERNNIR